jgi:drug/metabolite transporter (DMT)-like permease
VFGQSIESALSFSPLMSALNIDVHNIGDFTGTYAESLLFAKNLIGHEPHLLATADHVYSASLIARLAQEWSARGGKQVALIDTDMPKQLLRLLPATAVYLENQVGSDAITCARVGQPFQSPLQTSAVEAGLFAFSSGYLFSALEEASLSSSHLALAECLDVLAKKGRLDGICTQGDLWMSLETKTLRKHWDTPTSEEALYSVAQGGEEGAIQRATEGSAHASILIPCLNEDEEMGAQLTEALVLVPDETSEQVVGASIRDARTWSTTSDRTRDASYNSLDLFSHLPSDICDLKVQVIPSAADTGGSYEVKVTVQRQIPSVGWVLLGVAVCGGAAAGAFNNSVLALAPDAPPTMIAAWRFSAGGLLGLTPWLWTLRTDLAWRQMVDSAIAVPNATQGVALGLWGILLYAAMSFTSIATTVLFASMAPVLLVIFKILKNEKVSVLELLGVIIAIVGAIVCSMDKTPKPAEGDTINIPEGGGQLDNLIGIVLALGASLSMCVFFTQTKLIRPFVLPSHWFFVGHLFAVLTIFCYATLCAAVTGMPLDSVVWGRGGVLGWMFTWEIFWVHIVGAFVTDVLGLLGSMLVLKYVSPLVFTTVSLSSPIIAVVESLMMGKGTIPGLPVMIGGSIIVIGAGLVVLSSSKSVEVVDATDAAKRSRGQSMEYDEETKPLMLPTSTYGSTTE